MESATILYASPFSCDSMKYWWDDHFVIATFDGPPTVDSESYNKMDKSVRDARECQGIMKSWRGYYGEREDIRNGRNKGLKIKHVLQISLLLGASVWLLYQLHLSDVVGERKLSEAFEDSILQNFKRINLASPTSASMDNVSQSEYTPNTSFSATPRPLGSATSSVIAEKEPVADAPSPNRSRVARQIKIEVPPHVDQTSTTGTPTKWTIHKKDAVFQDEQPPMKRTQTKK